MQVQREHMSQYLKDLEHVISHMQLTTRNAGILNPQQMAIHLQHLQRYSKNILQIISLALL